MTLVTPFAHGPRPHPAAPQRGQGLAEYSIILVGIAVICIAIAVTFGGKILSLFGFAHDEVATLGDADFGGFDAPVESGGGGGGGSPGGGPGGGGGGPDGPDGGGDDGVTSTSGGGPAGGRGSGARSGGRGGQGAAAGDPRFVKPHEKPQRGTWQFGEGDDKVTVTAAGGRHARGSAAEARESEARAAAAARQDEHASWERRKRSRIDEDRQAADASRGGGGMISMIRFLLLAVFLIGILVIARQVMGAGKSGKQA